MAIYKINNLELEPISEKDIDLEKDIQKLTEQNLEVIFDLKFVSGALNQEFSVTVNEQTFYIDTLAFNESTKSFVIIEYKKTQSFSVIDQGYAYLSAMLSNQAEFVLELNKRFNKNCRKDDIDWEQSRIIFISPDFTNFQRNAINFKDLPMFLYEVKIYDNGLIDYNPIKPYRTSTSIKKITNDKTVKSVSSQVKVYNIDDLIPQNWTQTREMYEDIKQQILSIDSKTSEVINKKYVVYKLLKNGQWYNFAELIPQESRMLVHLDVDVDKLKDERKVLKDLSGVGHWATGQSQFQIVSSAEVRDALSLIRQSFNSIMNDENISWHKGSSKK